MGSLSRTQKRALDLAHTPEGLHRTGPNRAEANTIASLEALGLLRWSSVTRSYRPTLAGKRTKRLQERHTLPEPWATRLTHRLASEGIVAIGKRWGIAPRTFERALTTGVRWETYVKVMRILDPYWV